MAQNKDIKIYRCTNFGVCTKADSGEDIEIPTIETLGGIPECPGCHQKTLEEKVKKNFPFKLIGIILAALLLLGGIGIGVYMLVNILSGDSKPTAIKLEKSKITMKVGETIVLNPKVEPEGAKATFTFKVEKDSKDLIRVGNGGEVTALKSGNTVILIKCEEKPDISATCRITIEEDTAKKKPAVSDSVNVKVENKPVTTGGGGRTGDGGKKTTVKPDVKNGYGTVNLSYGTYSGYLSNGVPNGSGKLTFTRSYRLNSQYTAQPGEYVQGVFENGVPTFVTYYQKDGTVTKIKTR